jgi:hypothetical protein
VIARSQPLHPRRRVKTRPYARDGALVRMLIDDELHRTGKPDVDGARPLRPDEVSRAEVEDPKKWFARDADVLDSFDQLARYVARRR